MELYESKQHFIIQDGDHALWCDRIRGSLVAKSGTDLCDAWNPVCLGCIHGVVGKIKLHPDSDWRLILITERSSIGHAYGHHEVFRINKVVLLPLSLDETSELDLELCKKHHFGIQNKSAIRTSGMQQKALLKTWNSIKSAAGNVKPRRKDMKDKDKFEKRITEELLKMFNVLQSFYYTPTGDLTNSIQRQLHKEEYDTTKAVWQRVDDRFFWNKHMLQDLIGSKDSKAGHWVIPVIQGHIQIEMCKIQGEEGPGGSTIQQTAIRHPTKFQFTVISRRSRHRAGTRYKRRGVDEDGKVANYVETEQIIEFAPHVVSYVQVRGSVPVYWTQTGIKYRPPPRLNKGEEDTHKAFVKHFEEQLKVYKSIAVVSLTEQNGREKVISDAFLQHVLKYNSEHLTYISFDFHEYCRGMKFENVSVLTDNIEDVIKKLRYCWADPSGIICEQKGVFRVNCVDCLDRTNVVQTALARIIMETLCRKLGLLLPEEQLPQNCRLIFQKVWANNGDALSRQYAGTVALKGDYTRTGERKLTGLMKDGMHSANRYIRNTFRDAYRQATIDLMLGNPITEDLKLLDSKTQNADEVDGTEEEEEEEALEKEENIKQLLDYCAKTLLAKPDECMGSWALIDADPQTGEPGQQDADMILLLSLNSFYIARYDDEVENITEYQSVCLQDLRKIEIGSVATVFKSNSQATCIRLHYETNGSPGYFYTLRLPSTRLFNNMIVSISTAEEAKELLRAISQFLAAASHKFNPSLTTAEVKLEKKRSKRHCNIKKLDTNALSTTIWSHMSLASDDSDKVQEVIPDFESSENDSSRGIKSRGQSRSSKAKITAIKNHVTSNAKKTLANLNPMKTVGKIMASKPNITIPKMFYTKESRLSKSESRESDTSNGIESDGNGYDDEGGGMAMFYDEKRADIVSRFDKVSKVQYDNVKEPALSGHFELSGDVAGIKGIVDVNDSVAIVDFKKGSRANSVDVDEVVLDSCGILATSPNNSVLKQFQTFKPVNSIEMISIENDIESSRPESHSEPTTNNKDLAVSKAVFTTSTSSQSDSSESLNEQDCSVDSRLTASNDEAEYRLKKHKLAIMRHPHMKVSVSEGRIDQNQDGGEENADRNMASVSVSAFSKIRARVSDIMPSPRLMKRNNKQSAVNVSLENRAKSQIKYKDYKTCIIHL